MNTVLKRVLIAAALIAVCVVIFTATKLYGVWIITGTAFVLFILGLLRKDKAPGLGKDPTGEGDGQSGKEKNVAFPKLNSPKRDAADESGEKP